MSLSDAQKRRFEELAAREEGRLYSLCFYMLKNRADAEDCAQDALLKAYRHFGRLRDDSGFAPWVSRIAINCCHDLLRRKDRKNISLEQLEEEGHYLPDSGMTAYQRLERNERLNLLRETLAALPEQDRAILILRDIQGREYREIAGILRIREGTVKSRLNRARARLKAALSKKAELFDPSAVI